MSTPTSVAAAIHDTIDDVTTTVEGVHRSIAAVPFEILDGVPALQGTLEEIRSVQEHSIGVAYDLVRKVNDRVRRLTTGASAQ
jgi:hypothetical protein